MLRQQTYITLLQLNSSVTEPDEISLALQITPVTKADEGKAQTSISPNRSPDQKVDVARLAGFKPQQMQHETWPSGTTLMPIAQSHIVFISGGESHLEAKQQGKSVWIEWKAL